jgi:hypothetical protein
MNHNTQLLHTIRTSVLYGIALAIFLLPSSLFAQVVDFQMTPKYPEPNSEVTLRIATYITDINQSDIYWYIDGEVDSFGKGKTSLDFTTGELGVPIKISVVIVSPDESRIDASYTITPIDVDVLWEADTYTPPFYKGKAMPTYKSKIKVVALSSEDSSNATYTYVWKNGRITIDDGASGYGKSTYMVEAGYPEVPMTIGLALESVGGSTKYEGTLRITPVDPEVISYPLHPLYGANYAQAIGADVSTLDELMVRSEPYFFSQDDIQNHKLQYTWSINGIRVFEAGQNGRDHAFSKPEGASGLSRIEIFIQNTERWMQKAADGFNIIY